MEGDDTMERNYDKKIIAELTKKRDELKADIEELKNGLEYMKLMDEIDTLKAEKSALIKDMTTYVEKANATDMSQDRKNMRIKVVAMY